MTGQEHARIGAGSRTVLTPAGEVVEVMLLLPLNQFSALEAVADRLNLTVGRLLRRTVGDFLLRSAPADSGGADG